MSPSAVSPSADVVRGATTAGVGFVLPPDWWVLDLRDPVALPAQLNGLVVRQVGRKDDDATARALLRHQLQDVAAQAAGAGGVHLAVSLMHVDGVPVPASLTTYRLGTGPETGLADIISAVGHEGRVVELVDGPLGPMARCVGLFQPDGPALDEGSPPRVAQVRADYWVDAGNGGGVTLLAFSSPLTDLSAAMIEFFDSVISTVHASPAAPDVPGPAGTAGAR